MSNLNSPLSSARHPNPCLTQSDLVICDFDGTISQQDVGIAVIEALNLQEAWEIELRWRRGEIGSMECLAQQWGMVKLPATELLALIDSLPVDWHFLRFVELCRQRRVGLVVVSDGLDIYVDRMLARMGFSPCSGEKAASREDSCLPRFVNHADLTRDGVKVTFPHRSDDCALCANCKTAHLFRLRPHFSRTIYIGDGYSDCCPARYADIVFAKAHLAEFCQQQRLPHIAFNDFSDILETVS